MLATVVKYGVLFETVTLSSSVSIPPSLSVAVAAQTIVSNGDAVDVVSTRVELVPKVVEPLLQA
jgi:hypothetical protein